MDSFPRLGKLIQFIYPHLIPSRLTAISQYYCYEVFPSLQSREEVEKIKALITEFHENVKAAFHLSSYVMDVVVWPDNSIQIIELNPFGAFMSSGAALYNWETDLDLLYGESSTTNQDIIPSIRVLTQLLD